MNLWWGLIVIVAFYFFLVLMDTTVFHNKFSDIKYAMKSKVFLFLIVFSIVLAVLYFIIWKNFIPAILFIMYCGFLSKLIIKKL